MKLTDYCIDVMRANAEAIWMLTEKYPEENQRMVRQVLKDIAKGEFQRNEED